MSRTTLRVTLAVLATAILPAGVAAQGATVSAELAYRSDYLFAGLPFATGDVTQATVSVAGGAITLNGYAVYDHELGDISEVDVYGDYYFQVAPMVGAFLGGALYNFRIGGSWQPTPEAYAGLVVTAPLNPTLFVARDFDLGDGTHAMLILSHDVTLPGTGLTLGLSGNLDYNDGYYTDISAFSFANVGLRLNVPVGPATVSPLVVIQRGIDDYFEDVEVLGVAASYTF